MIKRIIPLVALVLSGSAMAQIGIGTKKAANAAQLDVVASDKGILLPRIELKGIQDRSAIKGDMVESLLLYHTGNAALKAGFYYWKDNAWTPLISGDTFVDRKNNVFTIGANPTKNGEESLIITDTENHSVYLAIADIANNSTFVTNLIDNQEFITKLGDNIDFVNHITNNNEFIENIINKLTKKYGNVNYDPITNSFFYYDENEVRQEIDWSTLNTVNVSFTLANDHLIVTDSEGHSVSLAVTEIANNKTFVENIAMNQDFITKLGDNIDFVNHITNNNEFIENIINKLTKKYGNVNYDPITNSFFYYDENEVRQEIDWSTLNTVNVSFTLANDHLIVTDSEGHSVSLAVTEIANNKTFVENIAMNQDFITKLGDNIDFVNHITNNNEFIENIINKLTKKYGNVNYDPITNSFFYYDENEVRQEIDWSALNTVNVSFTLANDHLIVTDSEGHSVSLAVTEIANNKTFVENIAMNQDFITKLGDNIDFVNHITNNEEFIENIINKLTKKYGNVNYDPVNNTFFYYDENEVKQEIDWSALNTVNVSFTLENDYLVVTDSNNHSVSLAVTEIANNKTFVENIAMNQDFITKLGDNIDFVNHITNNEEFIENIINKLTKKYGNVNYDPVNNTFFYYDENEVKQEIDWSALNTVNVSFTLENDYLVVTDSNNHSVSLAVTEIANNKTFVENIAMNQDFITKLGDNIDFVNHITNNEEFIENIINKLTKKYGNVNYDPVNNTFFYYDENEVKQEIDWSALNTVNVSFTLENDYLVVTDSNNHSVSLAVTEIANNKTFVENIAMNQDFITKLGDNIDFVNHITNNEEFIENIINKLTKKYGNVNYDPVNNTFFYYDENEVRQEIDWSALNTVNVSFTLENDYLVVTDSNNHSVSLAVTEIANNKTFVENIAMNQDFITKLGDNIDFVNHITNNEEFIENIINKLTKKYGNVNYDPVNNTFFYYDENEVRQEIDWSALNTVNVSFTLENDYLVVTDSNNHSVSLAVTEIANNKTFVENIATNQDFITKLGDNIDFVNQITNNEEFIENIVNKLAKKYGNVNYDTVNNTFFYYDENEVRQEIDWSALNTVNVSFTLENDYLVVTDSNNHSVSLAVTEIANNKTFVENIATNQDFITKLGDNIDFVNQITNNEEFIENIVNKLAKKYGNVNYDTVNNTFFYYDENEVRQEIDWSALNTVNVSFTLENDHLVVTDSNNHSVSLAVAEIASNSTFVTTLVDNQEFITKLGDSTEFQTIIKDNSVESVLALTNKAANENEVRAGFSFNNGKSLETIKFSETLTAMEKGTDGDGKIEYYFIDETEERDDVVLTITQDVITDFEKIIEDDSVKILLQQFISTATGNVSVVRDANGNIIIKNATDTFNLTDEIRLQETNTLLSSDGAGVYVYKNEEAIKTNAEGITINVVSDVQNNFQEIIDNSSVQTILNEYLTNNISNIKVIDKNGDVVFVINEGGVDTEVNISEIIRGESYVASLEVKETGNANDVKAGFTFNDGKNSASEVFAETLTSLNKGTDADQKIEYSYEDETGQTASTKITVTQDIIHDFDKIIADNSVKTLLETFISTSTGDVVVSRNENGDLIIKASGTSYNLTDEIRSKESLTSLKYESEEVEENGITVNKNFLIYTPERGNAQRIDITTLVESNETLTSLLGKKDAQDAIIPAVYIYTDENKVEWEIDVPAALKNSTVFNDYLTDLISNISSAAIVNYSYNEELMPGKWLNTDKRIAQKVFDVELASRTNIVQVSGDFASVILHARLINKQTNSITEGVIRTAVVNNNTQIVIGIADSLTVLHPVGSYYLILEYVKK